MNSAPAGPPAAGRAGGQAAGLRFHPAGAPAVGAPAAVPGALLFLPAVFGLPAGAGCLPGRTAGLSLGAGLAAAEFHPLPGAPLDPADAAGRPARGLPVRPVHLPGERAAARRDHRALYPADRGRGSQLQRPAGPARLAERRADGPVPPEHPPDLLPEYPGQSCWRMSSTTPALSSAWWEMPGRSWTRA